MTFSENPEGKKNNTELAGGRKEHFDDDDSSLSVLPRKNEVRLTRRIDQCMWLV